MICPKCGAEYRQGFTKCADCDVFLVSRAPAALQRITEGPPKGGRYMWGQVQEPELGGETGSRPGQDWPAADDPSVYKGEPVTEPGDPNHDPFCSFWKGADARICAELCTVLDEAGIPHKTIHRQDHLFNFANQAPYELGVPASLYEKAEQSVKDAFGTDESGPADRKLLANGDETVSDFGTFSPWLKMAKAYAEGGRAGSMEPEQDAAESIADANEWLGPRYPEDATVEVWSGSEMDAPATAGRREMIEMSLHENDVMTRSEQAAGQSKILVLPEDEAKAREIVREILEGAPPE